MKLFKVIPEMLPAGTIVRYQVTPTMKFLSRPLLPVDSVVFLLRSSSVAKDQARCEDLGL